MNAFQSSEAVSQNADSEGEHLETDGRSELIGELPFAFVIATVTLFCSALQMAIPLFSLEVFNRVIPSGNTQTLFALSLLLAFVLICHALIECSRSMLLGRAATKFQIASGRWLTTAGQELLPGSLSGSVRDAELIAAFIASRLAKAVLDAPLSLGFIVVSFYLSPVLGWVTVGSVTLVMSAAAGGVYLQEEMQAAAERELSHAAALVASPIVSFGAGAAMGIAHRFLDRAWRIRGRAIFSVQSVASQRGCIEATRDALRYGLQGTIFSAAAFLVVRHQINVGAIVASGMLFSRALAAPDQLSGAASHLRSVWRAWRRLAQLRGHRPEVRRLPPLSGDTVKAVSITLEDPNSGRTLLQGIDLVIQAGEVVAVLGSEGSGKSLLAAVVAHAVRPTSGYMEIDGYRYDTIGSTTLGDLVGYLPADDQLGDGDVYDIISRGTAASMNEVVAAAEMAKAHHFIQAHPLGYATRVESKTAFSFGQRRRIALARCCFREPALLVLDEPTLGLDVRGHKDIAWMIERLRIRGSAILIVTNSPILLALADRFLILNCGEIEVAADRGAYEAAVAASMFEPLS